MTDPLPADPAIASIFWGQTFTYGKIASVELDPQRRSAHSARLERATGSSDAATSWWVGNAA